MDEHHRFARVAATLSAITILSVLALGCDKLVLPDGSCTDVLQGDLIPTRNPNVFEVDICGAGIDQNCRVRTVEVVVDDELRGQRLHGSDVELWCYCDAPYTVYFRDLACISPPLRIWVETGDGGPNGEPCQNLPVGMTTCH